MARARKTKPVDTRMAFDFGPAPTSITVNGTPEEEKESTPPLAETTGNRSPDPTCDGAAAMPISGARTTAEPTDVDESLASLVDAQPLPKLRDDPEDGGAQVQAEVVTPRRDEVPSGNAGLVDAEPNYGSSAASTSTDMSERPPTKSKKIDDGLAAVLRASADAEREATIATMAECAAIALVRGASREVHDMIVTELRRRFRGHTSRIEHHLKLRGIA